MDMLRQSKFDAELKKLIKTKVYLGISAGALVIAKDLAIDGSEKSYSTTISNTNYKSLGLLDFYIKPHLNSPYFPERSADNFHKLAESIKEKLICLDDNSAIKVIGSKIDIISEGTYLVLNG